MPAAILLTVSFCVDGKLYPGTEMAFLKREGIWLKEEDIAGTFEDLDITLEFQEGTPSRTFPIS